MGTKYLARSAEVLSEADRQQGIIDFMLFTHEQNSRMYGPNEKVKWEPGTPLYSHPQNRVSEVHDGMDYWNSDGVWGNHARPMIEEFIDGETPDIARCGDCQTTWGRSQRHVKCNCSSEDCPGYWESYGDDPGECFLCGEEVEPRYEIQGLIRAWNDGARWVREREYTESLRFRMGFRPSAVIIDGVDLVSEPMSIISLGLNDSLEPAPLSFVTYAEADAQVTQEMWLRMWGGIQPYIYTPTTLPAAFVREAGEITVIEPWYAPVWEYSDQRPHWPPFRVTFKIYNAIRKAVRNPHQREVHESLVPVFEPREFRDEDCAWWRARGPVDSQSSGRTQSRRRDARRSI